MQITLFGRTDKRAVIYTLMKLFQSLGDVALISPNPHFRRLTEDGDEIGHFQNVAVFVTNATGDEIWEHIEHRPEDFDHVIMDGLYNDDTQLYLYVQGAGVEVLDEYLFDVEQGIKVLKLGKGKDAVPYTRDWPAKLEHIEFFKQLVEVSPTLTSKLAKLLEEPLKLSKKTIGKVVNKK